MPSSRQLISSQVLTSTAASVTFSSIPGTFKDLILKVSARNDDTGVTETLRMQVNNNTGTVYSTTYLYGEGTNVVAARDTSVSDINDGFRQSGGGATSNTFANIEIYIPSYTASQNKPISGFSAAETNAAANNMNMVSANLVRDTNAITSIQLFNSSTKVFVSGSSFYLYGLSS